MSIFSGSYLENDVQFLVKQIEVDEVAQEEKEVAIQTGKAHYSEMISKEYLPTKEYFDLFETLVEMNGSKLAEAVASVAEHIHKTHPKEITLISLLRAGTPIGVLLKRTLEQRFHRSVSHYSVSIVRDRGIDVNALDTIFNKDGRSEDSAVFIDGWTAKGVITRELKHYVSEYNKSRGKNISDTLMVLSDIGGTADVTSSYDDYAIPSGVLNSIVSGLVSRSIWNDQIKGEDYHGVMYYKEFEEFDRTLSFIEKIMPMALTCKTHDVANDISKAKKQHHEMMTFVSKLQAEFKEPDINMIKPGIAEATRVMLRRVPKILYLKNETEADVQHLIRLAEDKGIPIQVDPDMPIMATALISNMKDK